MSSNYIYHVFWNMLTAVKFKLTKIALTYVCEDVTYFQMYHSLIFLYAICQANKIY